MLRLDCTSLNFGYIGNAFPGISLLVATLSNCYFRIKTAINYPIVNLLVS